MERPTWDRVYCSCLPESQTAPEANSIEGFLEQPIFAIGLKIIDTKAIFSRSLVGTVIDNRYAVESELGHGGLGHIFLARDLQLHRRPVVIKLLSPASTLDDYLVKKFSQEVEALSRFNHPGIVSLLGAGELDDGNPFIVMQYVSGPTLRSQITPEGMDFYRAASIVSQLGVALDDVHDKGILHCDVKPENIMLQRLDDKSELVKIVDFGIASVTNSVVDTSANTKGTLGTLRYVAPEQLRGDTLTTASDIYSMGVVAFEMLTGRRPFDASSGSQLLELQRAGVRSEPIALRPGISRRAQSIVLRALSFDPAARHQKASDFGNQLSDALVAGKCSLRVSAVKVFQSTVFRIEI